jgi:endonuclease I
MSRKVSGFLVLSAFLIFSTVCRSANPNGYYNTINGKKAQALKTALSTLLLNHTVQEYSSLWTFFKSTDVRPDGTIWDMYSSTIRKDTWGMNREHSFPKSWWGGDVNMAYTDINHLYPADGDANMAKSNYPLGVVGTPSFNNGVTKVGNNTFPGYSNDAFVFEPGDEYKGDFARTYFYIVTCYQDYNWKYTYMVDQNVYPTLKTWARNLLLQWHRQDPVSEKELNRNEAVFKIQNNRNPFIDYPQLVEYIWGDSTNYVFALDTVYTEPKLATPTNDTKLEFGAAIVGTSKTRTLYVKGTSLSSSLSVFMEQEKDYLQFGSAVTKITKDQGNNGYKLTMSYHPTKTGYHEGSLLIYDGGIQGSVKVNMSGLSLPIDSLKCPVPLAATSITSGGFTANWNQANYADSYCLSLYSYENSKRSLVFIKDSIPESGYEVNGLDFNKNYSYTLKTRIGNMLSEESAEMPVSLLSGIVSASCDDGLAVYTAPGRIYMQAGIEGNKIEIYNLSGRKVYEELSNGFIQTCSGLSNGVYIVRYLNSVKKIMLF